MGLRGRVHGIPSAQGPSVQSCHQEEGHAHAGDRGGPRQRHEVTVPQALSGEGVQGKQVGEVGDRKEQRPGVGDPQRRHGEQTGVQPDLAGHRDAHRGEQHRSGVDREHHRAHHRQGGEEPPQQPGAPPTGVGHPVPGDVEDPGALGHLRGHGDREEEDDHRQKPRTEVQCVGDAHRGSTSSTQGAVRLAGSCRSMSKARPTTSATAGAERGASPISHRWRATRPRVRLAM